MFIYMYLHCINADSAQRQLFTSVLLQESKSLEWTIKKQRVAGQNNAILQNTIHALTEKNTKDRALCSMYVKWWTTTNLYSLTSAKAKWSNLGRFAFCCGHDVSNVVHKVYCPIRLRVFNKPSFTTFRCWSGEACYLPNLLVSSYRRYKS